PILVDAAGKAAQEAQGLQPARLLGSPPRRREPGVQARAQQLCVTTRQKRFPRRLLSLYRLAYLCAIVEVRGGEHVAQDGGERLAPLSQRLAAQKQVRHRPLSIRCRASENLSA